MRMSLFLRTHSAVFVAAVGALTATGTARAGISGFGDFSGFVINQADAGSPPTVSIPNGSILLTNTGANEARSIFATMPQPVATFTASFTYQATNIGFNFNHYQGVTFVLETAPAGTAAIGTNTGLGYSGMPSSLGIAITLLNQGDPVTGAVLAKNGTLTTPTDILTLNAYSGNPIDVLISYNGSLVHQQLTDTVTHASWGTDYVLSPNLATLLGSSTAYVGFTGGTVAGANQTISNFQFGNAIPESTVGMAVLPAGVLLVRRRK